MGESPLGEMQEFSYFILLLAYRGPLLRPVSPHPIELRSITLSQSLGEGHVVFVVLKELAMLSRKRQKNPNAASGS